MVRLSILATILAAAGSAYADFYCQCLFPDRSHCCVATVSSILLRSASRAGAIVEATDTFEGARKLPRKVCGCCQAPALGWRSIAAEDPAVLCWRKWVQDWFHHCSGSYAVCLSVAALDSPLRSEHPCSLSYSWSRLPSDAETRRSRTSPFTAGWAVLCWGDPRSWCNFATRLFFLEIMGNCLGVMSLGRTMNYFD